MPPSGNPTVLIQHVHTMWSKKSRGGEGAARRNALPHAVRLPKECKAEGRWILHISEYSEWNEFSQNDRCVVTDEFKKLGILDLLLNAEDSELRIRYHRDENNAARTSPFPFMDLPPVPQNSWLRLRYNGRYVDRSTGNWWYEQSCYNVGWFETFSDDIFLTNAPTHQIEEIAVLR